MNDNHCSEDNFKQSSPSHGIKRTAAFLDYRSPKHYKEDSNSSINSADPMYAAGEYSSSSSLQTQPDCLDSTEKVENMDEAKTSPKVEKPGLKRSRWEADESDDDDFSVHKKPKEESLGEMETVMDEIYAKFSGNLGTNEKNHEDKNLPEDCALPGTSNNVVDLETQTGSESSIEALPGVSVIKLEDIHAYALGSLETIIKDEKLGMLIINNLPYETTKKELFGMFRKFGEIWNFLLIAETEKYKTAEIIFKSYNVAETAYFWYKEKLRKNTPLDVALREINP